MDLLDWSVRVLLFVFCVLVLGGTLLLVLVI